jgi:hypothetical protein
MSTAMPNELNSAPDLSEPLAYQIRLKGQLSSEWAEWFGGLTITPEDTGTTLLTGAAIDQAALHGLLKKIRDLGLQLISINPIEPVQPTADLSHPHTKGHAA